MASNNKPKKINLKAGVEAVQVRHCEPPHIWRYQVKDPTGDWLVFDVRVMRRDSTCPRLDKIRCLTKRLEAFEEYYKGR